MSSFFDPHISFSFCNVIICWLISLLFALLMKQTSKYWDITDLTQLQQPSVLTEMMFTSDEIRSSLIGPVCSTIVCHNHEKISFFIKRFYIEQNNNIILSSGFIFWDSKITITFCQTFGPIYNRSLNLPSSESDFSLLFIFGKEKLKF
jgi:hypothetical protein